MARYRKEKDEPVYVIERRDSGNSILAFLWGALIGAGVALLYAPRSGQETRSELKGGVRRLRQTAEDAVRGVQDNVVGRVAGMRDAVDAGRSAARESRADMERRIREARAGFESGARAARGNQGYDDDELES